MFRYALLLVLYIVVLLFAALIANPFLPLFARMEEGKCDNANKTAVEPRLPSWLSWFSTNYDNSLWGDTGWRTKHCPKYWNTYWGMVQWLYRNPCAGFGWSVLSHRVDLAEEFVVTHSGNGLDVDKGHGKTGWFLIRSNYGAFQYRWVKDWMGRRWHFEAGWLIDPYVKGGRDAILSAPRATFMFQPGIPKRISA